MMASTDIPIVLPATPTLPGGLPSIPGGVPPAPAAVTLDTVTVTGARSKVDWGIYLKNTKVIEPDSIISLEYRREWRLADYPMEAAKISDVGVGSEGAFQTYNKVAIPFDVRLRMTKGGSPQARAAFLSAVEEIAAGLGVFNVVSPEATYTSVNIFSLGYSRAAHQGLGLISLDIGLRQIRMTATAQFTNVKAPASQAPIRGGTVSTKAATALQQLNVTSQKRATGTSISGGW